MERNLIGDEENTADNESRAKLLYQASFGPWNGDRESLRQLLFDEGFQGVISINIHNSTCFLRFRTESELNAFVDHFKGFSLNNTKYFANVSKKRVYEYPPCSRIFVAGIDSDKITERDLYFHFSPYGYVKHIKKERTHAFIDFDNVQDAKEIMKNLVDIPIKGVSVELSYAHTAPVTDFTDSIIPLTDILPPDHKAWQYLVNLIQGRATSYE